MITNSNETALSANETALSSHDTVLLDDAVAALLGDRGDRAGAYVDCTYGRGGHSQRIAEALGPGGRLLVIDKDSEAIADARQRFAQEPRVLIQQGSFADLAAFVSQHGLAPLAGVLMDLGVSSPQLDQGERGFSFRLPGPLDMRMDQSSGTSAAEWLATASERELAQVLATYGEERYAKRIAKHLVKARQEAPIDTTSRLAELVEAAIPRKEKHKHPATRSFQAIRIRVNNELDALETCLSQLVSLLCGGGRLVVISFHSLEDRIVKRFMRRMQQGDPLPDKLPVRDAEIRRHLKVIGKPVRPAEAEIAANARARSAVMRVAEKLP